MEGISLCGGGKAVVEDRGLHLTTTNRAKAGPEDEKERGLEAAGCGRPSERG